MAIIILIVDENGQQRNEIKKMLGAGCIYFDAQNEREAEMLLLREHLSISAIMLCENSKVELLSYIRHNPALAQLPVLALAGAGDDRETELLKAGANDYIRLPCDEGVFASRLYNLIALREKAATFNAFQRDKLTGLYNREVFFERASWLIRRHEPGYYVMAAFDVDGFKVINDRYGLEKGDSVLHHIADVFRSEFGPVGGLCCRIMADNFAVIYPSALMKTDLLAKIRRKASELEDGLMSLSFSIGRYIIDDVSLPVSTLYDRAALALVSVKGRYDEHVAMYDETMREDLLKKQKIITEMCDALQTGDFEVWFQPQYNHCTGALAGAEALARWRHPVMGMVQPGDFIPLFEQNGFIYELDKFVWDSSCRALRKWIDEGHSPLPVSVNVSRYDIFREDVIDVLTALVREYAIPVELLRLEITESAFAKSADQIISVVKKLVELGFTIEIDDFGSGYSSLNTLKDVPAQIIKLDMRFMEESGCSQRSGNIIESVVRMARRLGMSVIAEGMETVEQADYLKSIGGNYVQGYLYAKPMPMAEYEALMTKSEIETKIASFDIKQSSDSNAFWDPNSMDTLIFNSYVGGACIFEFCGGKIELLRVNDKFVKIIGSVGMRVEDALGLDWAKYLAGRDRLRIVRDLHRSMETQSEVSGEYLFEGLPECPDETWLRVTLRVMASAMERHLVYCTIENVTALHRAEAKEQETAPQLELLKMLEESSACAMAVYELTPKGVAAVYHSEGFYMLFGYAPQEYEKSLAQEPLQLVHPEDRELLTEKLESLRQEGGSFRQTFRCKRKSGDWRLIDMRGAVTRKDCDTVTLGAVLFDITEGQPADIAALEGARSK